MRESALRLMELAKGEGIAVILVGHVTKEGSIAGPKTLEHLVDAVIYPRGRARRRRCACCARPRTASGRPTRSASSRWARPASREVADPARAFLVEHETPAPGSVVAATLEGRRPLLVEVQALVAPGGLRDAPADGDRARPEPARAARRGARPARGRGPRLARRVREPRRRDLRSTSRAWTCAVAIALASSLRDRPVRPRHRRVGEVGLLGELRPVGGTRAPAARGRAPRVRPRDRAAGARGRGAGRRARASWPSAPSATPSSPAALRRRPAPGRDGAQARRPGTGLTAPAGGARLTRP